jgi:hypothetical protein
MNDDFIDVRFKEQKDAFRMNLQAIRAKLYLIDGLFTSDVQRSDIKTREQLHDERRFPNTGRTK